MEAQEARAELVASNEEVEDFPSANDIVVPVDLRQLLDNLGSSAVGVITSPRGLDIPVGDAVIHDPLGGPPIESTAIVLAVGIAPDSTEARSLITVASKTGATVIFKMFGHEPAWVEEAEASGVALLSIPDEMSWSHLHALLALTIPSMRQSASIPGMAAVPLGDLFALANAIAGLVGGAITIEDQRARVLAYSNLEGQTIDEPRQRSILGRQVPDTPSVRDLYRKLWSSDSLIRVDHIEDLEALPRIAIPISVGKEKLGSIWALEGDLPLGEEAERALTEAARVASLHLIHARSSRDIERRIRGDLLRSLLEGRGDVAAISSRLGVPRKTPLIVAAFEIVAGERVEDLHRERLVDLVATYSEAFRLQASAVAIGRIVFCLLPVTKHLREDRGKHIAKEIQAHAGETLKLPIHAAVSSVVTDVRDVSSACREAEHILRVLNESPEDGRLASIDDVASRVTLLTLKDLSRDHPDLVRGPIQEIVQHDTEKGTNYLETLRAFLDAFGDVPVAAASLDVHPNTFRYRIRRLTEVFDIDLTDPDDRVVIELQLRLLEDVAPRTDE